MKHTKNLIFLVLAALMLFACKKDNPTPEPQQVAVPQIILNTDIASSTDDLFAMQLLYRYAAQGLCKLLGVVVDRMGDTNAAIADLMNNYYGFPTLPIGLERNGTYERFGYINYTPLAQATDTNGNLLFARTYSEYSSLLDGYLLYRHLLANAPDGSVTIMLTGIPSTIANLLNSDADQYSPLTGVELVRRKVKRLYYFPSLLFAMNLTGHREERFLMKIEAQDQGVSYTPQTAIVNRCGIMFPITVPSKEVLLSMKLSALLTRAKGRDFYDTIISLATGRT